MKKVREMPTDVTNVFEQIQKDVVELHYRWRAFKELYTGSTAIDLMNYAAPNFFTYIYDATLSDLISAISRLTDNKKVAGNDTLGFGQLVNFVEQSGYRLLTKQLNARLKKIKGRIDKIRNHRNNRISHSNLDIRTNTKAKPLPILQARYFENIISEFSAMLNMTDEYFGRIPTAYQLFYRTDSGNNLLYHLETSKKVHESPDKVEILTKLMTA
jgi:AbiU2